MKTKLTALILLLSLTCFAQGTKISNLPAANALTGTEVFPTVQSAETRKASLAQVLTYVLANSHISGTDTRVLFFDGANNPAGDAGLTYNKTTDALTAVGTITGGSLTITGEGSINDIEISSFDEDSTVTIGYGIMMTSPGVNNVAIGSRSSVNNSSAKCVAIGYNASVSSSSGIAIGYNATATESGIAIGFGATVSVANQVVITGTRFDFGSQARFDNSTTGGQTRFLIYDVDNGTLERVTVGAADSGGSGFKVLRIPN